MATTTIRGRCHQPHISQPIYLTSTLTSFSRTLIVVSSGRFQRAFPPKFCV